MSERVTVVGAGIVGLWQALTLARAGVKVRLLEQADGEDDWARSASWFAGAMLSPDCEAESAPDIVRDLGHEGLALWRSEYPDLNSAGSLVVATARDQAELALFAKKTRAHRQISGAELDDLEPQLAGRFPAGLFFENEAHMAAPAAMTFLLDEVRQVGVEIAFGVRWDRAEQQNSGVVIDCRGMAARRDLDTLRGVRGERVVLRSGDIQLTRPVRLLHPRHPLYVVPWGDGRFTVGATVIESEDDGAMTLRSALELLGMAYALNPAFAEAEIVDFGAGVRPAFPDNIPACVIRDDGQLIHVNGAYRHGFLLAPVLAQAVCGLVCDGARGHPLLR